MSGSDAFEEVVPGDRAIWQSDRAKTYQCPLCLRHVFSQHEGDDLPTVLCGDPHVGWHRLAWSAK